MNSFKIYEFFIFNRQGICILHIDMQDSNVVNLALKASVEKNLSNRYKLIFGLLFSMKLFVKSVSSNKQTDYLKSFVTKCYKLHYEEFLNGLRFVMLTSICKEEMNSYMKEIFMAYYVNFISKNMFIEKDTPIKSDIFCEMVRKYLYNLM